MIWWLYMQASTWKNPLPLQAETAAHMGNYISLSRPLLQAISNHYTYKLKMLFVCFFYMAVMWKNKWDSLDWKNSACWHKKTFTIRFLFATPKGTTPAFCSFWILQVLSIEMTDHHRQIFLSEVMSNPILRKKRRKNTNVSVGLSTRPITVEIGEA